jgi:hypothetical protein
LLNRIFCVDGLGIQRDCRSLRAVAAGAHLLERADRIRNDHR